MNRVSLTTDQRLEDRPFTHPDYTAIDARQLRYMLLRLSQAVFQHCREHNANRSSAQIHELFEADGRHHRIIPIRPKRLAQCEQLEVVGFFGQRCVGADSDAIVSRDKMLFDEMTRQPGLLSYSSLELTNGDYGNCVLFRDEAAKAQWNESAVHIEAVRTHAPLFYKSVRLYNGTIFGTALDIYKLELKQIKYYDYSADPHWHGVRPLID